MRIEHGADENKYKQLLKNWDYEALGGTVSMFWVEDENVNAKQNSELGSDSSAKDNM
jgi:hypothetical protein